MLQKFSDIYVANGTVTYDSACLKDVVNGKDDSALPVDVIESCRSSGSSKMIEENISYVAGNSLWAVYQVKYFININ